MRKFIRTIGGRCGSYFLAGFLMALLPMTRKILFVLIAFGIIWGTHSQSLTLKKGVIQDSVRVGELATESFALFVPSDYDAQTRWPLLMVFDMQGKTRRAMAMYQATAENHGFIMVGSNAVRDTLAISDNIERTTRMIATVQSILSVDARRMYTTGFKAGGKMAALVPVFIKAVRGVVSLGASLPNSELLSIQNRYHYIGIVGEEDFNYTNMLDVRKTLNTLRYPNHLLVFNGGEQWPGPIWIDRAFRYLKFAEMATGVIPRDTAVILAGLEKDMSGFQQMINSGALRRAEPYLNDMIQVYRPHLDIDSLRNLRKSLRKDKKFRLLNRQFGNYKFRETLLRDDYAYYMEEDALSYNYNNLGWWQFQMEKLNEYLASPILEEKRMGVRLKGFVNALVEDNLALAEEQADPEGRLLLWMLKTITDPSDHEYYLKVIQESARIEEFGTALFYVEEAFKNGFKDVDRLNQLEHTALLRITTQYRELLDKYSEDPAEPVNEE